MEASKMMTQKGMLKAKRAPASVELSDDDFAAKELSDADFAGEELSDEDFLAEDVSVPDMSLGQALRTRAEEGITFGARPFVAGVGGAIGEGLARLKYDPKGRTGAERLQYIKEGLPEGFTESRQAAQAEQRGAAARLGGAGLLVDIGTGVLTAPLTPVRTVGQAAKLGAAMGGARALGEAESVGEAAAMVGSGAGVGAGVGAVGKGLSYMARKLPTALTGIPEKAVDTFRKRPKDVEKVISKSAGDIQQAADTLRESWQNSIQNTRQTLGKTIGDALDAADPSPSIEIEPFANAIDEAASKLNPRLYPEQIDELASLSSQIRSLGDDSSGLVSPRVLHEAKEFLQSVAKPSYQKGGQIFMRGDHTQKAAKAAAAKINEEIRKKFPAIKEANDKLRNLHLFEETANKNLLKAGGPEGSVIAAGMGDNRNASNLKKLGSIVGRNFVKEAEDLAAAKAFMDPDLLPVDFTGKATSRQALGGLLGGSVGSGVGAVLGGPGGAAIGSVTGGVVGAAASSPAALKAVLKGANITEAAAKKIVGAKNFDRLMTNKAGRAFIIQQLSQAGAIRASEE